MGLHEIKIVRKSLYQECQRQTFDAFVLPLEELLKARFLFNSNILFLSVASATQNSICFAYCDCRLLANSIIFLL